MRIVARAGGAMVLIEQIGLRIATLVATPAEIFSKKVD
jgi:hypothetical protein